MPFSVLLLVNTTKNDAVAAASDVRRLIERHGRLAAELPAPTSGPDLEPRGDVDLVVVLGGDGTLLSQTRRCIGLGAPMLGVNFGRLGFMAEFDVASLTAQAPAIFGRGEFHTTELSLLRAETFAAGAASPRSVGIALNDAVVTAGPPYRMISLDLAVDGNEGPTIHGDGVVVCTALGSTAYNLSAGGPILTPTVDAYAISPVAAHSLSFRPIVVPAWSRIELVASRVNVGDPGTSLVLDGKINDCVRTGDRIEIRRHDKRVRFVTNPRAGYWSRLLGKLEWAKSPRLPTH